MRNRYFLRFPDATKARGSEPALAFHSVGAEGMAEELQDALSGTALFDRWRNMQEDPDAVDPGMGAVDPQAKVEGQQHDLSVDLVATTDLPGAVFKHRLKLLAGSGWQLRDVTSA
jgi:hypothetical protein